ncbi:MAG: hypothetical protein J6A16_12230 [Oscillospiraceae bacterium]|nr:hypothetical protein [Oscillospiraceae bacterium]
MNDNYKIPPNVYRELKYLCLQYEDMRREIAGCYGISAVSCDSVGGSSISDPTAARAEKAMRLSADVDKIDEALRLAADEPVRSCIRRAVTCGLKYEHLGAVPMGRRQFYEARRRFFYLLKLLKKG